MEPSWHVGHTVVQYSIHNINRIVVRGRFAGLDTSSPIHSHVHNYGAWPHFFEHVVVMRLGALAPGINTAPTIKSWSLISFLMVYSLDIIGSHIGRRDICRVTQSFKLTSRMVTLPKPAAILAAWVPRYRPPPIPIPWQVLHLVLQRRIPLPPMGFSRYLAPSWMAILPPPHHWNQQRPVLVIPPFQIRPNKPPHF